MKAEVAFEKKEYAKAARLYGELSRKFPGSSAAPASLLKQGVILGEQGDAKGAQGAFTRLVNRYPDSAFAPLARVEALTLFYRNGDYSSVIQGALKMTDEGASNESRLRKYAVLGDAYLALGGRVDAVDAYFTAMGSALTKMEREAVSKRIQKAADGLTLEEIGGMLERVHEKPKRGYLLFQRFKQLARFNRVDEGLVGVNEFLTLYSEHPLRAQALAFRDALGNTNYNAHVIGCLLPFSGRYAEYGKRIEKGIAMAFNEALKQTGISDLQVLFRDTGSDDETTQKAVRELVDAGASVIIGPVGNVEAAAREAQLRGVPLIALSGKEGIAASGDFIFRNFMTRRMQVKTVVTYAFEVLGLNDFAILYPDEPYGKDFMRLFWDEVDRFGGEIRGVEMYTSGTKDFASVIGKLTGSHYRKVKASGETPEWGRVWPEEEGKPRKKGPEVDFEAIFIPDGPENLQLILPQLAFHDLGGVYTLGTNLWHSPDLIKAASKQLKGSIIPDGFFSRSRKPQVLKFVKAFKGLYGASPTYIEAISYDSTLMVFSLIASANPQSRGKLRDALLNMKPYAGVTGRVSFDHQGEAERSLTLLKGRGRRFVELPR